MNTLRLTNTQKWFALMIAIIALCVAFWTSPSTQVADSNDASAELAVPNQPFGVIDIEQDAVAIEAAAALSTANKILATAEQVRESESTTSPVQSTQTEAWQIGDRRAPTPSIPLNEKVVDYDVVQVEQKPKVYPQVGESVVLPMLNGEKVVVDIESSVVNPNGDYTWSGHLQGYGDSYPVVMTYGSTSTMATITTPAGSYSMATVKGLGWLYKNPAEVELVDNLHNDFLEPPLVN